MPYHRVKNFESSFPSFVLKIIKIVIKKSGRKLIKWFFKGGPDGDRFVTMDSWNP